MSVFCSMFSQLLKLFGSIQRLDEAFEHLRAWRKGDVENRWCVSETLLKW